MCFHNVKCLALGIGLALLGLTLCSYGQEHLWASGGYGVCDLQLRVPSSLRGNVVGWFDGNIDPSRFSEWTWPNAAYNYVQGTQVVANSRPVSIENPTTRRTLIFDGSDDYVMLPTNSTFAFTSGSFTIAIWICPSNSATVNFIFAKDTASQRGYSYGLYSSKVYLERGGSQIIVSGGSGSPSQTISNGSWSFMTLVYDSTNVISYVNAVKDSQVSMANPSSTISSCRIGMREYSGSNYPYQGQMEELLCFNVALNATQVTNLYQRGRK